MTADDLRSWVEIYVESARVKEKTHVMKISRIKMSRLHKRDNFLQLSRRKHLNPYLPRLPPPTFEFSYCFNYHLWRNFLGTPMKKGARVEETGFTSCKLSAICKHLQRITFRGDSLRQKREWSLQMNKRSSLLFPLFSPLSFPFATHWKLCN